MTDDLTQEYGASVVAANDQLRQLVSGEEPVETPGVTVTPDPNDPDKTITTITEPLPRRTELVGDGNGDVTVTTGAEVIQDQPLTGTQATGEAQSVAAGEPPAQPAAQGKFTVTDPRINEGQPTPFDSLKDAQAAAKTPEPLAKIEENVGVSPLDGLLKTAEQKDAAKNFVDLLNIPVEHLAGFITKGDVTQTATPEELGNQILAPVASKLGEMLDEKQMGLLASAVGILGMAVIDPLNPALAAGQAAKAAKQLNKKPLKDAVEILKSERGSFQPVPGGAKGKIAPFGATPEQELQALDEGRKPIVSVTPTEKTVEVKELLRKYEESDDISWEFIGETQVFYLTKNKADALKRIERLRAVEERIKASGIVTSEDVIERGRAYGYSEDDIVAFLEQDSPSRLKLTRNPYGSSYSTKKQAGAETDPEKVAAIKAAAMRHPYSMEEAEQIGKLDAAFQERSTSFTEEMQKQRRAPRPDTVVNAEAEELTQQWNGILNFPPGTSLTDAQAKAAQKTFDAASEIVQLTAQAVQREGYTPQGIEAFAAQFSTARNNLIALLGGEREAGATLRQFRTDLTSKTKQSVQHVAGEEKLPRISDPYQQQMLDFFLKQEELAKTNPNAVTAKKVIDQIAALPNREALAQLLLNADKPGFWDVWTEQWLNALLSGLAPVKNIVGNPTILAGSIVTRGVAAGIDSIGTGMVRFIDKGNVPRDVYMGEVGQMLYGSVEAMADGFALAWKAFKEGQPQMRGQSVEPYRISATSEFLNMTGLMGRFVDYFSSASGRLLLAGDELAKAMAYRAELRALALRKAYDGVYSKGLEGVEAANYVQATKRAVLANPMAYPEIHKAAEEFAIYVTLQKELGEGGKAIQHVATSLTMDPKSWIGAFPVGRFLLPFTTIAINSPKMAGEYTGLAKATIMKEIQAGGARKDIALAKLATGTAFMGVMAGLAAQGLITGTGPKNPQAKQQWEAETGKIPNAFYDPVSKKYRSTSGFEPYNTIMGAVADIVDIYSHAPNDTLREKASAAVEALAISISNNFGSKSYLKGATGSMQAVISGDVQSFEQYAKRTVPSMMVPYSGALRQVEQGVDPVMREALTIIEAAQRDIPGLSSSLPPERSALGRIMIRDGGFWNPMFAGHPSKQDKDLLEVLNKHGVVIPKVQPTIDGVPLTSWEYDAYQQMATDGLAEDLAAALTGSGEMTDFEVDRITDRIVAIHHRIGKQEFIDSSYITDLTKSRMDDLKRRKGEGERTRPSPFLPGRLSQGSTAPGGLTR